MEVFSIETILYAFVAGVFTLILLAAFIAVSGFLFLLWMRNRKREHEALNTTLLQVALPRDNEIKIDAAEQLFASLVAFGKPKGPFRLKNPPHLSFELVGMPGDIRFYISVPNKFRDFVEKQIN